MLIFLPTQLAAQAKRLMVNVNILAYIASCPSEKDDGYQNSQFPKKCGRGMPPFLYLIKRNIEF